MPNRLAPLAAAFAFSLAAGAAFAQPAPQAPPPAQIPVTYTVPASVLKDPKGEAARFVHAYAIGSEFHFIVQWGDRLCIKVLGLPPAQAAAVKSRIEAVAQSVSLKLYSPVGACAPTNVSIVFTPDAQRTLDDVIARRPHILGDNHSDTRAVKTVTRPVQAWYQTCDRTDCGPEPVYKHLEAAMVLVDQRRIDGMKLGAIADYIAMLLMSEPQHPDRCQTLPSVIDLFAGPCAGRPAPTGLTATDLAYLKAAYTAGGRITRPDWQNGAGEATLEDVAGRMGMILAGATDLPNPGVAASVQFRGGRSR